MLDYIFQSKQSLKHISFLRRIFLKEMSGKLHIQFADGEHHQVCFFHGNFADSEHSIIPILQKTLTQQVLKFAWQESSVLPEGTYGWNAPWITITRALDDLKFENNRLIIYYRTFCQLPPVILKDCLIHFFDCDDEKTYYKLHQLSLGTPRFNLKLFFSGKLTKTRVTERVRVLLLVYLLGYLRPAPNKAPASKKADIVERILKRF